MKGKPVSLVLVGCAALTGCIPTLREERVQSPPHAAADASPSRDRRHELAFVSDESDDLLTISATEAPWCRDTTPMVQDTGMRRHLDGGALSYVVNGIGAAALAGIGVGLLAAPCNGSECTPQQTQTVQVTGGVVAASAIVPLALIVWNAMRSTDDVTSAPIELNREWRPCGKAVAAKRKSVHVTFSDGTTLDQVTDGEGQATFDLSQTSVPDAALASGAVVVSVAGSPKTPSVSLHGISRYNKWVAALDAAQRQKVASQQAEQEAQQHAASAARDVLVAQLDRWAPTVLHVAWSNRSNTVTRCYNLVDVEVPCNGAAAVRSELDVTNVDTVSVRNDSSIAMDCTASNSRKAKLFEASQQAGVKVGDFTDTMFGLSPQLALVPAHTSHVFTIDNAHQITVVFIPAAEYVNYVVCAAPSSDVARAAGISTNMPTNRIGFGVATDVNFQNKIYKSYVFAN